MFNNTNVRFSTVAQVSRTVKFLKANKTTKRMQYPPSFKIKVLDLMVNEMQKAENGDDTFIRTCKGNGYKEFAKVKFYEACGIGKSVPSAGRWETMYDTLNGDATLNTNVVAISRHGLGEKYSSAESQGLGEIAKETGALARKKMETKLKHNAKEMGYKLVKVA